MKPNQKSKPWKGFLDSKQGKELANKYLADKRNYYIKGRIALALWGSFHVRPKRRPTTVRFVYDLLKYRHQL